jgi:pimeloyl-ACP methyl ester carboxylesterase
MFKPLAVSALALCCFGSVQARSADIPAGYDYPYTDPWLATASVALLKDPKLPEKQVKDVTVFPARANTPLFQDKARVYYVTYRQEKPADLVVLISGLGSVAEDPLALYLGGTIFAMGYNVIVVPDAFNWQFALGASTTGYVGVPSIDAGDLETFIARARDHAVRVDGMKVRQTKLVGYSMGALEGAFLAAREAQHPRLKFSKVVLLNPPVDTFYDLHRLDSLSETGAGWSAEEKKTVKARAFKLVADANLTDPQGAPYFRDLAQRNTLTDDQLKFVLFGLFRDSLRDVIMVTQQIKDEGILKTPATQANLGAREVEAGQYGFEDYLNKFVVPQLGGTPTATEMLKTETLYGLKDFLASHREVEIFHNADDFLLRPQDTAYLQATLGNRLTLFPHGGHMGNIWYPTNQQMLAQALASGPVPEAPKPIVPPQAPKPIVPPEAVATSPAPAPDTSTPETSAPVASSDAAAPAASPPVDTAAAPAATETAPEPVTAAVTPPAVAQSAPVAASPAPTSALSPPSAVAPPVGLPSAASPIPPAPVVASPPSTPGEDPLAPPPQPGTTSMTTTTTTTTVPVAVPTYTVKVPQIPSATPSDSSPVAGQQPQP